MIARLWLMMVGALLLLGRSVHAESELPEGDFGNAFWKSIENAIGLDVPKGSYGVGYGLEYQYVVNAISWTLTYLFALASVMLIAGGYKYLKAAGNEDKVQNAKDTLKNAVIGLALVLICWAFTLSLFKIIENSILTNQPS
jgi:hypothetical protein